MLDHLEDLSTATPDDLSSFLRDIGLTRVPSRQPISTPRNSPQPRDVSWFARGEECPH